MTTATSGKPYIRNLEDIEKIVHHAKLSENTLHPVTQAIYFSDSTKNYKLMELDNDLCSQLKANTKFVFRGRKEDKVVLCTDTKTYDVKEAETSNSLLLIPGLKFANDLASNKSEDRTIEHKDVIGVFHMYYELKVCKPRLQTLRRVLEQSSYRGSEMESSLMESGVKFYTTNDLLTVVQASEAELRDELSNICAFEMEGHWRVLEFNYHFRVITYFLNLINEQSWKFDEIPPAQVLELLDGIVPTHILEHLISVYTTEMSQSSKAERYVQLVEDRVCRVLGEALLRPCRQFGFNDFLSIWQGSVPEGLTTNLQQLNGLVYVDCKSNQKIIYYCPEYELPEEVAERIQYLFNLKDKWTFEDIKPYIEIFATNKMNENTILTKFARASTMNGVRMYSSRHGK